MDKTVSEFLLFILGKIPTEITEDASIRESALGQQGNGRYKWEV